MRPVTPPTPSFSGKNSPMKKAASLLLSLALVAGAQDSSSPKRGIGFNEIAPADLASIMIYTEQEDSHEAASL